MYNHRDPDEAEKVERMKATIHKLEAALFYFRSNVLVIKTALTMDVTVITQVEQALQAAKEFH